MSSEIIYLREEKPSIIKLILVGLKRMLKVLLNPFTTFNEISMHPEIIGPAILFILLISFSLYNEYFFREHIVIRYMDNYVLLKNVSISILDSTINIIYVKDGNIVSIGKASEIYMQNIYFFILLRSLHFILIWIATYIIFLIICNLLRGRTTDIFKSVGYFFSINLMENIVKFIYIYQILNNFSLINIITGENMDISETLTKSIVVINNFYLSTHTQMKWIIGGINWFLALWGIVISIAFLNSFSKISISKSIIGGVIAYIVIKILSKLIIPIPVL